ncbi:hypothetical protein DOTSEDRAFT_71060 [Dothistroma septosporum NZE10]|uniref:Uncharacterized protein n=1 Tax=Dothistroma septosporum (strain NZE10 / CBS 128990) TaxID=675120 RepID=N1PQJ3_DOTSN|nr:hypothetical protein DOTSEDRAFT_71060 [Dothistroma septosporum NZE10]
MGCCTSKEEVENYDRSKWLTPEQRAKKYRWTDDQDERIAYARMGAVGGNFAGSAGRSH